MKKIYKYGTGEAPPEGAEYLTTVVQTKIGKTDWAEWDDCFFVWHYFLVEVEKDVL